MKSLAVLLAVAGTAAAIQLTVTPAVLTSSPANVTLSWTGASNASGKDWIAVWTADNSTYMAWRYVDPSLLAVSMPRGHVRPPVDPSADQDTTEGAAFPSSGSATFTLYNIRQPYAFWFYPASSTNHTDPAEAISAPVDFQDGLDQITQRHIAPAATPQHMVVSWTSGRPGSPATVKYGTSSTNLSFVATGSSDTYTEDDLCEAPRSAEKGSWIAPGWLHEVELDVSGSDFAPGDTVYYSVGSNGVMSDLRTFKVPAVPGTNPDAPTRLIIYADMGDEKEFCAECDVINRQGYGPGAKSLLERLESTELKSDNPANLIAHVGDISYARNTAFKWDVFMENIEPVASQIPYIVGIGNHEYDHLSGGKGKDPAGPFTGDAGYHPSWGNQGDDSGGECAVPVFHRFHAPETGSSIFYYSTTVNNVYFIMLSFELSLETGSPQRAWLEKELASVDRSRYPWLLVAAHRPLFCSQDDSGDYTVGEHMREIVGPLFQAHNVDAFFGGHYHSYERTCPLGTNETCLGDASGPRGTVHITVGTAGIARSSLQWMGKPWSLSRMNVYGYGVLDVHNSTSLTWSLIASGNGTVLDSVTLHSHHNFGYGKPAL